MIFHPAKAEFTSVEVKGHGKANIRVKDEEAVVENMDGLLVAASRSQPPDSISHTNCLMKLMIDFTVK